MLSIDFGLHFADAKHAMHKALIFGLALAIAYNDNPVLILHPVVVVIL